MKKILVINTVEFSITGIATVIMNYYEHINRKKYHMDFVVNKYIEPCFENKIKGNGSYIYILDRNHSPLNYLSNLKRIIRENQYDIVHVHGNSCTMAIDLLAAYVGGCKVRIAHSHNSTCSHTKMHKMLKPLFRLLCTDRLACSTLAGEWLFGKKEFMVIENAMDIRKYRYDLEERRRIREYYGLTEMDILIGHVGVFNEQKNQAFLIEILKELLLQNVRSRLLLVGKGPLEGQIRDKLEEYNLIEKVIFYGTTENISSAMSAMDVFVFPSKWEGLGIVMVEAQLVGLPCIASACVPRETKISNNCYYIALDAPVEEWCNQIINIVQNQNTCIKKQMIVENVKRYDINVQINTLEQIYK